MDGFDAQGVGCFCLRFQQARVLQQIRVGIRLRVRIRERERKNLNLRSKDSSFGEKNIERLDKNQTGQVPR